MPGLVPAGHRTEYRGRCFLLSLCAGLAQQRQQPTNPVQNLCCFRFFCFFFVPILSLIYQFLFLFACVCLCVGSCAFRQSVLCSVFLSAHEPGAWRDLLGTDVNELCLRKSQIQNVCEHDCRQSHTSLLVCHPAEEQSILPFTQR